jgi:chromate transporter
MWCTFVPPFIWVFAGGPYVEMLIGNRSLNATMSAVTAAVVGVILNLAVWFGLHTLFGQMHATSLWGIGLSLPVWSSLSWVTIAIAATALLSLLRFKAGMIPVLAASCMAGFVLRFAMGGL